MGGKEVRGMFKCLSCWILLERIDDLPKYGAVCDLYRAVCPCCHEPTYFESINVPVVVIVKGNAKVM